MSTVVDRALAAAGLADLVAERLSGALSPASRTRFEALLPTLDILVLGAFADRVRGADVGDVVRIHLDAPRDAGGANIVDFAEAGASQSGQAQSRAVAAARVLGAPGSSIRMSIPALGLTRAQLGLAFGADALVAPLDALGFAVYEGDEADVELGAQTRQVEDLLRERELAALVIGARRTPRIVRWTDAGATERDVDMVSEAKRRFRAPGREEAELRARREKLLQVGRHPQGREGEIR